MLCIYDVLSLFIFILFCIQYKKYNINRFFYYGVLALLFVMCFKSPATGEGLGDLQEYVNLYLGKSSMYNSDEVEPGLSWICKLLHIFPLSEFLFISVTSLIIMSPILYGITKYSQNKLYSLMLLLTLTGVWLVLYIAMRQALAQTFILTAIFVYLNRDNIKKWKIYIGSLILLSMFFHSTPYILIPLTIVAFFLPQKKKWFYMALVISLLLSSVVSQLLANMFLNYFGNVGEVDRITHYISDETYGMDSGFNLLNFAPLTILASLMVYYIEITPKNAFFVKAFVLGIVLYNLLGNIPLVNRAVCFFFILGAIGSVPKINTQRKFLVMSVLILYFIWRNNIHYMADSHSAYLPYHFIWE